MLCDNAVCVEHDLMDWATTKIKNAEKLNIWERCREESRIYIKRFENKSYREITVCDKDILLCFIGDAHLGNSGTDYDKIEHDARLIRSCEYALNVQCGDAIDNFVKQKIFEGTLNSNTTPKEQLELLRYYLELYGNKIIIMISGNHERWTKELVGVDTLSGMIKQLIAENKIQTNYAPDEFLFDIKFKKVKYTIKLRHKYKFNSAYNLTHCVKQMWRMGDHAFDIGVVAHHHQPAVEDCQIQGQDLICIRPGSYKVADTYARKEGFNSALALMPCVALNFEKKRMTPFKYLAEGIAYINYKNGRK